MNEWSNEKKYEFAFNNQVPRVFEVINAIIAVKPGAAYTRAAHSLHKKAAVHAAARVLEKLWSEAFSACHIKSINAIKNNINSILTKYHNSMKNMQHAMNNLPLAIATCIELVLPANDKVNAATQVEFFHCDTQPPTRKTKVCTDDIKCALAEMTVAAQISPEKARMGAQAFAKKSSQLLTFS